MTKPEAKLIVVELFEEIGLMFGGLVATHEVEDDLVWRFVRCLDAVRLKTMRKLDQIAPNDPPEPKFKDSETGLNLDPHPALQEFILKLRKERVNA